MVALSPMFMGQAQAEPPLNVTTTVGMIADVVQNVGGSCVEVSALMGPGTDPHSYQLSARDVRSLQNADLIVYAGHFLEEQMARAMERLSAQRPVIALMELGIPEESLLLHGTATDPHIWMNPRLWALLAPAFAEILATLEPSCAETAFANATIYAGQLNALGDWVAQAIQTIPPEHRILVTAHDAFGYYAREFGLQQISIQGVSTMAEASVADIRTVAQTVASANVPAVFVESTLNPRTVEAVINAAHSRGSSVVLGGELFSDAMGSADTAGGTYIGMIYSNTATIVQALGGAVPPLPSVLLGWAEMWSIPQ
jgi:manganese/zinc/iron transport system substrate-binding protein